MERVDPLDALRAQKAGQRARLEGARAENGARSAGRHVEHEAQKHPAATAGGAATGAVAGGVVGGPVGAIVGAVSGAARGLIAAEVFDDVRGWWQRRRQSGREAGPGSGSRG